jgi:GT2 family glycosyltransferase
MQTQDGNMIKKEVCIILLNYNNNPDTVACVRSVVDSTSTAGTYTVVVDNSDKSSDLGYSLSFCRDLKLLFPGKNLGFAAGINFGLKWAIANIEFDYLFILNNDTLLAPDCIEKLIAAAIQHKEVTLFSPTILTNGSERLIWYGGASLNLFKMTPVIRNIGRRPEDACQEEGPVSFASGCALFIQASCWDLTTDLFDPAFFMYEEDFDLSLRILKAGGSIYYVPEATVFHSGQGSQAESTGKEINQLSPRTGISSLYLRNSIANRYYLIGKHFKGLRKAVYTVNVTVYWLLKCVQYVLYLNFKAAGNVVRALVSGKTKPSG